MQCAAVGLEIWLLFLVATAGVALLVVAPGKFQRSLREQPRLRRRLRHTPDAFFERVWFMRLLGIPLVMWAVAILGVYCFFHGADRPPPVRGAG
jgi:hypothetical protein